MKKIIILLMIIVLFIISSIGYLIIKVPSDKEILTTKELSIPLGETKKIEINTKAEYDIKDNTLATVDTYGNVMGIRKGKQRGGNRNKALRFKKWRGYCCVDDFFCYCVRRVWRDGGKRKKKIRK